jgi:hypothetical protein
MAQILDANSEQLVTDLAADYSERIVAGDVVSIGDYIDKLPDAATREAFKTLANMSRLIMTIEAIGDQESQNGHSEGEQTIIARNSA